MLRAIHKILWSFSAQQQKEGLSSPLLSILSPHADSVAVSPHHPVCKENSLYSSYQPAATMFLPGRGEGFVFLVAHAASPCGSWTFRSPVLL